MKSMLGTLGLALCVLSISAHETSAATNSILTEFLLYRVSRPAPPETFADLAKTTYTLRLEETAIGRLSTANLVNWEIRYSMNEGERDSIHGDMKDAVITSFKYSARKLILDTPWFEWTKKPTFLGQAFRNSLNGVEEEELGVIDPDLPYRSVSTAWWSELEDKPLRYGVRPFRTSPYVYMSYAWKDEFGEDLFFINTRYFLRKFHDHLVEITASVPITSRAAIDLGARGEFEPGRNNFHPTAQLRWLLPKLGGEGFFAVAPLTRGVSTGFSFGF